ncbi:MAG: CotH kinase family protein [Balneolales bacterium]|nr:CotH kinase family protein [Balneolales bacterium]
MKVAVFLHKIFKAAVVAGFLTAIFSAELSAMQPASDAGDKPFSTLQRSDTGELIHAYLFMENRDLQRLYTRNPRSDDRLPGYLRWNSADGRVQGLRGVRFRGNTSRYHIRKSFNIRFNQSQPQLFGGDRLNFNAMYTDPSGLRERLAWQMFHELEQPASRVRYTTLTINNSYEGIGLHIQRIDEELLRSFGLNQRGTLVRDMTRRRGAEMGIGRRSVFGHDLSQTNDVPALLASLFESRGNPDYGELAGLIQWIYDTPAGDEFEAGLRERFDVDNLTDWLAIHYLIGDVDAFGDDYWLYRAPGSSAKWMVLPWDNDLSFGKNERDGLTENRELGQFGRGLVQLNDFFAYEYPLDDAGWDNDLIVKYHQSPGLRRQFEHRMLQLMDEVFTPEWFDQKIEKYSEIIGPYIQRQRSEEDRYFLLQQRQHHGEIGRWAYYVENVRDFIELRYAFIRSMLLFDEPVAYHNFAEFTISPGDRGRMLITDDAGWTFAALDIKSVTSAGGEDLKLRLFMREAPENDGITQNWQADFLQGDGLVEAVITLYYRNDIASDGRDNYYIFPEATGRQWELQIVKDGESLDSRVNPYSNKIEASVTLSGSHLLQVLHP